MKAFLLLTAGVIGIGVCQCLAQEAGAPLPPDNEYVQLDKDGHLSLNGQRVRYWAVIGKVLVGADINANDTPEQKAAKVQTSRKGTDVLVQRYIDLGFNACRYWGALSSADDYTPGDGSNADCQDYFIKRMKDAGLKIWWAGMNNVGEVTPDDVGAIDDPATAEAWKEAVAAMCSKGKDGQMRGWAISKYTLARIWDLRLEAICIERMKKHALHFNKHTGLRWCDDPVFVVWELSNEEWWMSRMRGGLWQKLPAFFKNQLVAKWNQFLKEKYGSDDKLKAAWKSLLPGESIDKGTVLLVPMAGASKAEVVINDANPAAKEALTALEQEYKREDFEPQRGSDVLEFFTGLVIAHKQREAAAVKQLGKSTRLSPMVYDTGTGYDIHCQYLHQTAGAVSHDGYVNGTAGAYEDKLKKVEEAATELEKLQKTIEAERNSANVGRWINWLLKPPGICQGVPWLEHNKVDGMPYLCYETQIQQPAKYRADFPLRLGALACIQDWDFVCWHYFGPVDDAGTAERPFDKAMDITTGTHPQGYHYTYDEVQNAMMRAAGLMWRQGLLKPAPNPTHFIYGRKSLYSPDSMPYGGSYGMTGMDMLQTVYQYGVRIKIDPSRQDDEVIGPVVSVKDRHTHNPYTPTEQISFDWKKGFLKMDSPAAASFTGLLANYGDKVEFASGVVLKDVNINNPEGIYEPVGDDEKYIAFALHSLDGQPLDKCKTASLSLVSTSFNSGFSLGGAGKPTQKGTVPVLVARVGAAVQAKALAGMEYTLRDWHMQDIGSGTIGDDGVLTVPGDKPVFVVELAR